MVLKVLFWLLLAVVGYTYVGYGILLWLLTRGRRMQEPAISSTDLPSVAHIIAAYNEEDFIEAKINNALAVDYPVNRSRIIVVADGSSDRTVAIASQHPGVTLLFDAHRKGKVSALNRAVAAAEDAEILIFSDANTLINAEAFRLMVRHYTDPRVGGVSGEKKVVADGRMQGEGEGLYWKYESLLKKLDSDLHTVVGAAGELFSIRSSLYEPAPETLILDDLHISLGVCRKGLVVRYEPGAYALEGPSSSLADEMKRKIRISAGAFQSLRWNKDLLDPRRYGILSFQFLSHRVLRWVVCPFALPLIYLLNFIIFLRGGGPAYGVLLLLQTLFYLTALAGALVSRGRLQAWKLFYVPYYFVFMNAAVWAGLYRYLNGSQSAIWEKARRGRNV